MKMVADRSFIFIGAAISITKKCLYSLGKFIFIDPIVHPGPFESFIVFELFKEVVKIFYFSINYY